MERLCENSSGLRSHWDARAADNNLGPFEAHLRGLKYLAEKKERKKSEKNHCSICTAPPVNQKK